MAVPEVQEGPNAGAQAALASRGRLEIDPHASKEIEKVFASYRLSVSRSALETRFARETDLLSDYQDRK